MTPSNRLYKLDELNRRERDNADRMTALYINIALGLALFLALAAIVRSVT